MQPQFEDSTDNEEKLRARVNHHGTGALPIVSLAKALGPPSPTREQTAEHGASQTQAETQQARSPQGDGRAKKSKEKSKKKKKKGQKDKESKKKKKKKNQKKKESEAKKSKSQEESDSSLSGSDSDTAPLLKQQQPSKKRKRSSSSANPASSKKRKKPSTKASPVSTRTPPNRNSGGKHTKRKRTKAGARESSPATAEPVEKKMRSSKDSKKTERSSPIPPEKLTLTEDNPLLALRPPPLVLSLPLLRTMLGINPDVARFFLARYLATVALAECSVAFSKTVATFLIRGCLESAFPTVLRETLAVKKLQDKVGKVVPGGTDLGADWETTAPTEGLKVALVKFLTAAPLRPFAFHLFTLVWESSTDAFLDWVEAEADDEEATAVALALFTQASGNALEMMGASSPIQEQEDLRVKKAAIALKRCLGKLHKALVVCQRQTTLNASTAAVGNAESSMLNSTVAIYSGKTTVNEFGTTVHQWMMVPFKSVKDGEPYLNLDIDSFVAKPKGFVMKALYLVRGGPKEKQIQQINANIRSLLSSGENSDDDDDNVNLSNLGRETHNARKEVLKANFPITFRPAIGCWGSRHHASTQKMVIAGNTWQLLKTHFEKRLAEKKAELAEKRKKADAKDQEAEEDAEEAEEEAAEAEADYKG